MSVRQMHSAVQETALRVVSKWRRESDARAPQRAGGSRRGTADGEAAGKQSDSGSGAGTSVAGSRAAAAGGPKVSVLLQIASAGERTHPRVFNTAPHAATKVLIFACAGSPVQLCMRRFPCPALHAAVLLSSFACAGSPVQLCMR
eukprot:247988-Chlamydomonas_euryale.AAC.1